MPHAVATSVIPYIELIDAFKKIPNIRRDETDRQEDYVRAQLDVRYLSCGNHC
jgi:hypothetical protein